MLSHGVKYPPRASINKPTLHHHRFSRVAKPQYNYPVNNSGDIITENNEEFAVTEMNRVYRWLARSRRGGTAVPV